MRRIVIALFSIVISFSAIAQSSIANQPYLSELNALWQSVQDCINKNGITSSQSLVKFCEMETAYGVAMGYVKVSQTSNLEGIPILSYDEYLSLIHRWRDIIASLTQAYGYEYVKDLQNYCKKEHSDNLAKLKGDEWNQWIDFYTYGDSKPQEPEFDYYAASIDLEIKLNILANKTDEYERNIQELFQYLGTIKDRYTYDSIVNTQAEEILDISNMLSRHGQYENAFGWLVSWYSNEKEKEQPRRDLTERYETEMASLAMQMGDRETAAGLTVSAAMLSEQYQGFGSYRLYNDINNLLEQLLIVIQLYFDATGSQLDLNQATEYSKIAERIISEDCRGRNGKQVRPILKSNVFQRAGMLCCAKGDYAKGEQYYRKSIDVDGKYWSLTAHEGLASTLGPQGKYVEAELTLKDCLSYAKDYNNLYDRQFLTIYNNLAYISQCQGHWEDMASYMDAHFNTLKNYYIKNTQGLTSKSRRNFWDLYWDIHNAAFLYGSTAGVTSFANGTAFDALLFHKNLLVRQSRVIEENILHSSDDDMKNEYILYKNAIRSGELKDAELHESNAMYLYSYHPEFLSSFKHLSWTDVQQKLAPDDIAIEFTEISDRTDNVNKYVAFVLKKKYSSPIMIKLCSSQELDNIILTSQSKEGYSSAYTQCNNGDNVLYSMIWSNLENELKGTKRVYFSPSGILNQINIEILSKKKNSTRICDKYEMHRLSSTGLICAMDMDSNYTTATLFGGLDYNSPLENIQYSASIEPNSEYGRFPVNVANATRGKGMSWSSLTDTEDEVNKIGNYLLSKGIHTTIITKQQGTEEMFKRLACNNCSILHIATHGFYYSDTAYRDLPIAEEESASSFISPLKRCGIIMSGGNHLWKGHDIPNGVEDGTLRAEEIAGMDLSSTKLLVLSACQTGLGDLGSDGVYGLQRGFKLAGVNTIIMSLWEVDSAATELMMITFYSNLVAGKSKYEAFTAAQAKVRNMYTPTYIKKKCDSSRPQDPEYYWASFILID